MPINPKKYSCKDLKKIHTRNLIMKKNSCGSKIPLPPHNFSNGPSLSIRHFQYGGICLHFTGASFNTVFSKSNFKITLIFSKMTLHLNYTLSR